MVDTETTTLIGYLGAGVGALITIGVGIREYLKREKVGDAADIATIKGYRGNDTVLDNLVAEVARLSTRVGDLEGKVLKLTTRLNEVRVIALDCYQLAGDCDCPTRDELIEKLKQIIQDT